MDEAHDDTELQNIIDGEESSLTTYLGYDIGQVVGDVEYHDGDRSNTILLDHGMVTAVATVKVDSSGDFTYPETLTHQTEYVWYSNGVIQLITGGYFPRRNKYVEVTYTHGYLTGTLPNDLALALKKRMANVYHGSLGAIEIETETTYKIYTDKEIYSVFDRYARVQI